METSKHINFAELLARVDNDRELVRELLLLFKQDFPLQLQALEQSISQDDWDQTVLISHALKGMLSSLAMNVAAAHAAKLEELAKAAEKRALKSSFADFVEKVQGLPKEADACMSEVQT